MEILSSERVHYDTAVLQCCRSQYALSCSQVALEVTNTAGLSQLTVVRSLTTMHFRPLVLLIILSLGLVEGKREELPGASKSVRSFIYHFEIKIFSRQGPEEAEALLHFLLDDHLDPDDQHGVLRLLHGLPRGLHQEEEEGHGGGAGPRDQL